MKINNAITSVIIEIDKLNAFRMVKTTISDRAREYCSRTSHIFPPCIGGFMPFVSNEVKL